MSNEARWLRESSRLAAQTPPPELDWSRVEQSLFERVEREPPPRAVFRPEIPWQRMVAVAAVAACAALGLHGASRSGAVSPASATRVVPMSSLPGVEGAEPLATSLLRVGDCVHLDRAGRFRHESWAGFSAPPGAAFAVQRLDAGVVLALHRGSIDVSVQPGRAPASFVVLAGRTAIAVHGTRFSVLRRSSDVVVRVDEGVVTVGEPSRRGTTARWTLGQRTEGTFSLDGGRTAAFAGWTPPPMVAIDDPAGRPAHAGGAAVHGVDDHVHEGAEHTAANDEPARGAPSRTEPVQLTEALAEVPLGALRAKIHACYRAARSTSDPGVKVTVYSTLTLTVAPDGHVELGKFDPPLKPDAQGCASAAVHAASFPPAQRTSTLRLSLEF